MLGKTPSIKVNHLTSWQPIVLGILIGLLLGGLLFLLIDIRQAEPIQIITQTPKAFIEVDVAGSVVNPGLYRLKPGLRIYDAISIAGGAIESADLSRMNTAAFLEDGQRVFVPDHAKAQDSNLPLSALNLLDLNDASIDELMKLPGIGNVKAQAIVDYRNTNGLFVSIQDLIYVQGIGPTLIEEIRPYLKLTP